MQKILFGLDKLKRPLVRHVRKEIMDLLRRCLFFKLFMLKIKIKCQSIDDKAKKIVLQICEGKVVTNSSEEENQVSESITRGVQAGTIQAETAMDTTEYILFQFIPKPQKFEQIVRQATECGVKTIVPVIGEYSEKSSISALQNGKKDRLERIIKEARQQSGSPVDTKVTEPMKLEEAVEKFKMDVAFVLSERQDGEKTIREILVENQNAKSIGIACGSEGGISPDEIDFLSKKGLFNPIHFSVNILRCETAALYGIAAVQVSRK